MARGEKTSNFDLLSDFIAGGKVYQAKDNLVLWPALNDDSSITDTSDSALGNIGTSGTPFDNSTFTFGDRSYRMITSGPVGLNGISILNAGEGSPLTFSTLANDGAPDGTTDKPFTISVLFKRGSQSIANASIISKGITTGGVTYTEYSLSCNSAGRTTFTLTDSSAKPGDFAAISITGTTGTLVPLGGVIHVVVTYDGRGGANAEQGLDIIINGAQVAKNKTTSGGAVYAGMVPRATSKLSGPSANLYLAGLGHLAVWDRVLTYEEMQAIYHSLKFGCNKITSGFTSNPPRTQLTTKDNRSGAYPISKNYSARGLGQNLSPYDDEKTVVFHSSFASMDIEYNELPNDAQTLRVTETPHVRPYDKNRDFLTQFTDNTYDLSGFGSSLVGWWRFNEPGSSSVVSDLSATGQNADVDGSSEVPTSSTGTPNPSLSSGSRKFTYKTAAQLAGGALPQRLRIGSDAATTWESKIGASSTNKQVTISSWIKLTPGAADNNGGLILIGFHIGIAFSKGGTIGGASIRPGSPLFFAGPSVGSGDVWYIDRLLGSATDKENEWVHLVVSFDHGTAGAKPDFYVNSEFVPISAGPDDWSGTLDALTGVSYIGSYNPAATPPYIMNGDIASLSIFNRVLTSTEVSRIYQMGLRTREAYNSSANLQGWYTLDEDVSTSGDINDMSGRGRTATMPIVADRPAFSTSSPALPIAKASATFNSTTTLINAGGSDTWLPVLGTGGNGKVTVSAWVKPQGAGEGNFGRIVDIMNGYLLYQNNSGALFFESAHNGTTGSWRTNDSIFGADSGAGFAAAYQKWYHILVTYDNNSLENEATMYVNGIQVSVTNQTQPVGTPTFGGTQFNIGNRSGRDRTYDGDIASIAVWDKVLTPGEVYALYNAQSGVFGRSKNFEFQRGVILQPGNEEVNLRGIPRSEIKRIELQIKVQNQKSAGSSLPSATELSNLAKGRVAVGRLAKKINELRDSGQLKVSAQAKGNTVSIKQCMTGSIGNVPVSYENARTRGIGPILIPELNKIYPRTEISPGKKVTAGSINMSGGASNLQNFSTGLSVSSYWTKNPSKNDLVDSPNITGSIEVSGEVRKGVADYGLDFSSTPYTPFDESLVPVVNDDSFYDSSSTSDISQGFSSPLRDKVAIVIDCNPVQKTEFGFTSANRFPNTADYGPHVMCYYNFSRQVWEPIGRGLATGGSTKRPQRIDTSCIGFSRGLEIQAEAAKAFCRPTNTYGFPYHPKFHATGSQQLRLSSYIDKPFLLENYEYHFSGSFQTGNYHGIPAGMYRLQDINEQLFGVRLGNIASDFNIVLSNGYRQHINGAPKFVGMEPAIRIAPDTLTSSTTFTAAGSPQIADGDSFTVNVPTSLGGTGQTNKIIFKTSLSLTPNADEIWVLKEPVGNASSIRDTINNLEAAFYGTADASKVKYGSSTTIIGPSPEHDGVLGLYVGNPSFGVPHGFISGSVRDYATSFFSLVKYGNLVDEASSVVISNAVGNTYDPINTTISFAYTGFQPDTPFMGSHHTMVEKNILAPFTHRAGINTFFMLRQQRGSRFTYEQSTAPQESADNISDLTIPIVAADPYIAALTGSIPHTMQLSPSPIQTTVSSSREMITYGQWVSFYEYTGSAEVTYSDTNVAPFMFGQGTLSSLLTDRISTGDYVANTPYTGSTFDITNPVFSMDGILQSGLGRELNVEDSGGSAGGSISWMSNENSTPSVFSTYTRPNISIPGTAARGAAAQIFSIPSTAFNTLSPTGSYVIRGTPKVCVMNVTNSVGGYNFTNNTDGSSFGSWAQSFENTWSGNRTGINGLVSSRGLTLNTGATLFRGDVVQSQERPSSPSSFGTLAPIPREIPEIIDEPSPYILLPDDDIVLGWQLALPQVFSPYSGSAHGDTTSAVGPNMTLSPGAGKLVLYGSFIKDGKEAPSSYSQNLSSLAIHQVIGDEPVSDQFELSAGSSFFGSMSEQVVTGTMRPGDDGQGIPRDESGNASRDRVSEAFFAARGVQLETTGRYFAEPYNTGFDDNVFRPSRKSNLGDFLGVSGIGAWSSVLHGPSSTIKFFDYMSFGATQRTMRIESEETYYDSTVGQAVQYQKADGKKAISTAYAPLTSPAVHTISLPIVTTYGGHDPSNDIAPANSTDWKLYPNYTLSNAFLDEVANFAWQKGFPFENRYKLIKRNRTLIESTRADSIDIVEQDPASADIGAGTRAFITSGSHRIDTVTVLAATLPTNDSSRSALNPAKGSTGIGFDVEKFVVRVLPRKILVMRKRGGAFGDMTVSKLSPLQITENINLFWFTFGDDVGGANQGIPFRVDGPINTEAIAATPDVTKLHLSSFAPRGFKYGLIHSLPMKTCAHFRRNSFGQFRDMLEQRPYTRAYEGQKLQPSPISVRFVDTDSGLPTDPLNTTSQNTSHHMSSSLPYFDDVARNRGDDPNLSSELFLTLG